MKGKWMAARTIARHRGNTDISRFTYFEIPLVGLFAWESLSQGPEHQHSPVFM
jgi:hypothetical protein